MRSIFVLLLAAFCCFQVHAFDHNHAAWTKILKAYQDKSGMLNYRKLKADALKTRHPFHKYLADLSNVKLDEFNQWSENDQKAFLINAYNAYTVKLIVDHYPVKSIKKIGGLFKKPWSIEFFSLLDGKIKSLDPIEHDWLRPKYKDYRIHAAVNCASISCPPLRNEAYVGAKLDTQLDEQMNVWLNDKSRNQIDFDKKVMRLSKIFDWYEEDFVQWGGGVTQVVHRHLQKLLPRDVAQKYDIEYLDYDWGLNETK